MNKVIFLGAGASKDAGYPLTRELWRELKRNRGVKSPGSVAQIKVIYNPNKI